MAANAPLALNIKDLANCVADCGDHSIGFRTIRVVGEDRIHTPFGEVNHHIAAEPPAPAGDECDLDFDNTAFSCVIVSPLCILICLTSFGFFYTCFRISVRRLVQASKASRG